MVNTKHFLLAGIVLFLASFFNQVWAKTLQLKLERSQIEMGDIIQIQLIADFQTYRSRPNFDLLKDQFEVHGTQQSNNMQIVNGQLDSTTTWIAEISPKQPGELRIPSFEIEGVTSNPVRITVNKPKHNPQLKNRASFIEADLNKQQAYVQEEVIFTLRFYHLGRLISGNMRPPTFENALVKQLRNQFNYRKNIQGRIYEVFEWSYAFYPQKSGQLELSSQSFTGRLHLGGQLRSINDVSPNINLEVLPAPSEYPTTASWLPAKQVSLQQSWLQDVSQSKIRVGDSLTRKVELLAVGQLASQLPELQFENQNGLQIYPDKSTTDESLATTDVTTKKTFIHAIVPTKEGKLTLPAITVNWWNTQTNKLEKLVLPPKTLNVLPSLVTAKNNVSENVQADKNPELLNDDTTVIRGSAPDYWIYLTGLFAFLWLVTLVAYIRKQPVKKAHIETQQNRPTNGATALNCQEIIPPEILYQQLQKIFDKQPELIKDAQIMALYTSLKAHLFNQEPIDETLPSQLCALVKKTQIVSRETQKQPQLEPFYPK